MTRSRQRAKGRKSNSSFVALPHHILRSPEYATLNAYAVKLLLDLFGQFDGRNNGDLTAAWTVMNERGWKSKRVLYRSIHELEENGWIVRTRRGGRKICNLFAVSWLPINECGGKLDVPATCTPSNAWKTISLAPRGYLCSPTGIPMEAD